VGLESVAPRLERLGFTVRLYGVSYVGVDGRVVREERMVATSMDSRVKVIVKGPPGGSRFTLILRIEGLKRPGRLREGLEARGGSVDTVEGRLLAVFKNTSQAGLEEIIDAVLGAGGT
jgi:RNase P/RNase MRP subunit p29